MLTVDDEDKVTLKTRLTMHIIIIYIYALV